MELTGRLTSDAKVKTLKDKRQVVAFTIVINDYFTSGGEKKQEATYFNCSYWISTKVAQILTKGNVVQLSGRVGLNAYKGMDGEFNAYLTFHVNSFKLVHKHKVATHSTAEEPIPDGSGRIDVYLERADKQLACEVSVTTTSEWELHNVQKCLSAGYDEIIVCSNDAKHLENIKRKVDSQLTPDERKRVSIYEIQELFKYFDEQIIKESTTEKTLKGYRVKVNYESTSHEEMQRKHDNVIKTISKAIKK